MRIKGAFVCGLLCCCLPWCSPPVALALGLAMGMAGANPWRAASSRWTRELLKWSIVGLGFGMDFHQVLEAGRTSLVYTGFGIAGAMAAGLSLRGLLRVPFNAAFLISVGTSICGGSAIAAARSIVDASEEETAVSLTTILVLNSIALLAFPMVGNALGLTQEQFGLWAALAIHDTSSVVGAGLKYGAAALAVGTTVKLVRALWIVPVTVIATAWFRRRGKRTWPWFIGLFVLAAWFHSSLPEAAALTRGVQAMARAGFSISLFLIGAGLSAPALMRVGWRPFAHGLALWILVAASTLLCIRRGWIGL